VLDDDSKMVLSQSFKNISADWSGGCLTPGGLAFQARPRRSVATRRLGECPPESKRPERKSAFFPPFLNKKMTKGSEKGFSLPFIDNLKPLARGFFCKNFFCKCVGIFPYFFAFFFIKCYIGCHKG